jgi:hypothetical protein
MALSQKAIPADQGRPKGSVSIVAKIKAKFEEDPEYFEE